MQAREVLYAAVGAPVVAARKVGEQMSTLREKLGNQTGSYADTATKAVDEWVAEGEKLVTRISEGRVVEEISQKVDLDQAKEQVGKLRDQLEDMLATWRSSFRPEKAEQTNAPSPANETMATPGNKPTGKPPAKPSAPKASSTKASATKATANKPATKTSTAKTTKSSQAAKTSSAKSTSSRSKAS